MKETVLAGLVLCACVCLCSSEHACPPAQQYNPPRRGDRGALESLISTASVTREGIIRGALPYQDIRMELSRVYNRSSLKAQPFISLWVQSSENHLYIASFVLLLGVVCPLVVLGLLAFRECRQETVEEDEEEDDSRHRTMASLAITWSLAVGVVILLLLVCVFLTVLVSGNALLSSGVREGGVAVGRVLPALAGVRDDAVEKVEQILVEDYSQLRERVAESVLSEVGPTVAMEVLNVTREDVDSFYGEVQSLLRTASTLHNHTESILAHLTHPSLDLHPLNASLTELVTACAAVQGVANQSTSNLLMACENFTRLGDRLHPLPRPTPPGLLELSALLSVDDSVKLDTLEDYFDYVLGPNLTNSSQLVTDAHIGPSSSFGVALSSFLSHVHQLNNTLTFDLPASLDQLEEYLGPRYLDNWEAIRYACTLTFALIVLMLAVCLIVVIGRGILSTAACCNGGDELTHSEGAHYAGTTLKKVAIIFMGVGVVSSGAFGLFLCLGGVMGAACGPHGNFSSLIEQVIDDKRAWGGTFPLGWALIRNNSYPLTLEDVLDSCCVNRSMYESFHLEAILDVRQLAFSQEDYSSYLEKMRKFAESLSPFSALTPSLASLLSQLNATTITVQWAELQMLTADSLFVDEFIGFVQLQSVIHSIDSALSQSPDFNAEGVTKETMSDILLSANRTLGNLTSYIDEVLIPAVNVSASTVQAGLLNIDITEIVEMSQSLSNSVTGNSTVFSRQELSKAAAMVMSEVRGYSSHTQRTFRCHTGSCLPLSTLTDQFTTAFCHKVVPGVDVFWTTLLVISSLSLLVPPLSLLLAARLVDPELKESLSNKFHLWGSVWGQLRAVSWLLLSLGVCLWFVVSVATDQFFRSRFCEGVESGCCVECVWGVGVVFLLLASGVGVVSQIYQCCLIHRIRKCAHGKVKRYWVDRKKAIQFYTQLAILLLQDVPFLLLAGLYAGSPNTLTVPALYTIMATLTGILAYIVYLIIERGSIVSYCSWLKKTFTVGGCRLSMRGDLTAPEGVGNGHVNGEIAMATRPRTGRYGSSESEQSDDSQGTTQQDGDWQFTTGNHRLSNIPEHPEGSEVASRNPPGTSPTPPRGFRPPPAAAGAVGGRGLPPPIPISTLDDNESQSELSQAQPAGTVLLDHLDPSNGAAAVLRRQAAVHQPMVGGVEAAPLNFATPTNSDFGSNYSVMSDYPGYYSSQQHDDKDDYSDSDFSQLPSQRSRLTLHLSGPVGGVSADV